MLRIVNYLILIIYIFYTNPLLAVKSNWDGVDEAKVRIISPFSNTDSDNNIFLGLQYKLKEGWKTYWHSPGDGGFAQTIDWKNSSNVSSVEILWPKPKMFNILGLKSIGYENEVVFPLKIKLNNTKESSIFAFEVNYLTCKDICIPGKGKLELILNPGKKQITKYSFLIEKFLSKVPNENNKITGFKIQNINAKTNNFNSLINVEANSIYPFKNPIFFISSNIGLPVVEPSLKFSSDRKKVNAEFFYNEIILEKKNINISAVLIENEFAIKSEKILNPKNLSRISNIQYSYLYIFVISIIGGLILNLMPCVFPVLSLKLLSFLNYKEKKFYEIRKSFFITASGIIISFLLLSFVLIFLKLSGKSIGWGMQFQHPFFLMFLSLVLFLFSLNLLGFFEIHLPYYFNKLLPTHDKSNYSNFFNGFFATLLATPCSAPFVSTAVSAAFTQSITVMIGIFFFMGLGMSSPYIIAGIFPQSVTLLPKPGKWMIRIKYFLALLLFGTLIWITMILLNHFNYLFIIINIILGTIILISLKFFRHLRLSIITISIIFYFSLNLIPQIKINDYKFNDEWLDLTKINIDSLINKNIVFLDITADWCATCQFNKYNVVDSKLIQKIFKENEIIKVRGDWTKPNEKIQEYLNKYNRYGIPFNILYNKDFPNGIILSELLTQSEIIKKIELMKKVSK